MTSISISTKTVTGLAETGFESASVFLGFYFDVNEKHRTTSEYGPDPKFDHRFTLPVPAGFSILHVELVNESAAQPQVIGQGSIDYREIREKDTFVPLMATDGSNRVISQAILSVQQMTSRPAGQEEVPPSLPSIDTNVGDVLPPPPPYDGPMVDFPSEKAGSGPGAFQRQDSLASLGPEVPMPEGYGRGAPPPFQPPGQRGVSPTPSAPASSSVNPAAQGSSLNTEEAQRGTDWKKVGGVTLGAAAAVGVAAYAVHEYHEHERHKQEQAYLQHQQHQPHAYPPPGASHHGPPPGPMYAYGYDKHAYREAKREHKEHQREAKREFKEHRRDMKHQEKELRRMERDARRG